MSLLSETPETPAERKAEQVVKYHHVRTNLFRTIFADGVWYQMMPAKTKIHLLFYTERLPLPTETETVLATGKDNPDARVVRAGMEREMEVDVVLDVDNAKKIFGDLKEFLDKQTTKTP